MVYLGYVDEYMWPIGSAAGRVIKAHPELVNTSLQWSVQDINSGETVELPAAYVSLAAVKISPQDNSQFKSITVEFLL